MTLEHFCKRAITIGLYVAPLFLLVFYKQTLYPFITLKTYGFYLVIELAALAWFYLAFKGSQYRPHLNRIHSAILIFLAVFTVGGLISHNPLQALFSTPERAIGIIGLWHFYMYFLLLSIFLEKQDWKKYLTYLFWVSVAVSLFAFLQYIAPSVFYVGGGERPGGTLGNPAYLAGYLLTYLFLGWALLRTSSKNPANRIYVSIATLIVLFSFLNANTRGAMLGFLAGLALLIGGFLYDRYKAVSGVSGGKLIAVAAGIVIVLIGLVYSTHDSNLWRNVPGINRLLAFSANDASINNRLIGWRIALKGFVQNPILGVGFENFREISDANYDPRQLRGGFSETYFDKPHSTPFEMLATGGIIGFAAYIYLLWIIWRGISRLQISPNHRRLAYAAFIGYLIQGFFLFDTFGTYLNLFAGLAALLVFGQGTASVAPTGATDNSKNKFRRIFTGLVGGLGVAALFYAHTSTVYANTQHYVMLDHFTGEDAKPGMVAYQNAQQSYYPFKTLLVQDAFSLISRQSQLVLVPDSARYIAPIFADARAAIEQQPDNYPLRISFADAQITLGRFGKKFLANAASDLAVAFKLSPKRQQNWYVSAKLKLTANDFSGALADLQESIDLDPIASAPYYHYGLLEYPYSSDKTHALKMFDQALELGYHPESAQEYAQLGGYFGEEGLYDRAYSLFLAAHELAPENNEILAKLGIISYYRDDQEKAREYFTLLRKQVPDLKESENYPAFQEIFSELGMSEL